ncbi:MAG TPA: ABC transporter permease [Candidatus Acidoferrales bacterium]|jgi:predicted permease|nr:ABC transporter permease [Candidatus Acidoferrales bacterium]
MASIWQDVRYGLRIFFQKPAFTAVVVLTLALGIGANTAIFTLFDAILLESLPVREPARLVLFSDELSEGTYTGDAPTNHWPWFSYEFYKFLDKQSLPLESLCAFRMGEAVVSAHLAGAPADSQVRRATTHLVSGNYFMVMGVEPAMGRMLTPEDDRPSATPAAVVSYGYWKQNLGADPAAVGKLVTLKGTVFTIVGIAPQEFFGERIRNAPDFWLPLAFQPQIESYKYLDDKDAYWLNMIGRLRPGVTRAQAQVAVTNALQQFLTEKGGTQLTAERRRIIGNSYIRLENGGAGISSLRFQYSQPLHILLVVVGMVLLIACANVGNLLLARGLARRTEISVRLALGASRGRMIRQLLTESLLLATMGASCGLLLAKWGVKILSASVAGSSPQPPHLNAPVLLFTGGITFLAAVLFGLAPALQSGGTDLVSALKMGSGHISGERGRFGTTQGLVIVQMAVSLVLLVGASLFARSLLNLEHLPLGFEPENVLMARINPPLAGYTPENVDALYKNLLDRINALPGIRAATIAKYSPLSGAKSTNGISVQGYSPHSGEHQSAEVIFVGPEYPEVLGIPLPVGREIGLQDKPGSSKVAMVNEAFVRHYFPNENPIGHRFGIGGPNQAGDYEIVGMLKDAHFQDVKEKQEDAVFLGILQDKTLDAVRGEIEVRTENDPRRISAELRKVIAQEDPKLPISSVRYLREQVDSNFDRERLAARLVSFFGVLALLLACVGLYGVVAQGVARRTNEIGVRIALGAQRGNILWMVLRDILMLLLVGLAIGIPAAFGASHFISNQLYGLGATDILSFSLGVGILAVVMILAGFMPAHRASRVDPIVALHYE